MLSPSCTLAVLTSIVKGTPQFLAPELLGEAMIGHSKETDIWAFGMTVYVRFELKYHMREILIVAPRTGTLDATTSI